MEFLVGVDLQDTFILGWDYKDQIFEIEVEFSLWPESDYYLSPKDYEYTCYRTGKIVFSGVSNIDGLFTQSEVNANQDLDGSKDYGNIEYFEYNQPYYKIIGSFGNIEFQSSGVKFELTPN